MAATAPPQGLPLNDRSKDIKITIITLIIFSSFFVGLRLYISWKNRKFYELSDHFLWTGMLFAIVSAAFTYKTAKVGAGRHIWDPFITPAKLEKFAEWIWYGQLFNLYGMALIKLSICTYILKLDFSKVYCMVIWASIVIHVGVNFIFPSIILLGECQPISKHWDVSGTQPGSCWSAKPKVISGYAGAATNILTDLIYTIAPLVYIWRVQIPKRTRWGVRAVFLLGLITTTISALKFSEVKALNSGTNTDPTYTTVNLSIYALAEVFVGAFTASLPPLRKTFETLLRHVLPESLSGSASRSRKSAAKGTNSYVLQDTIGSQPRPKHDLDNDSEHSILKAQGPQGEDAPGTITCTTEISLAGDERGSARGSARGSPRGSVKGGHEWV